jgi:hypothetical protein
MDEFNPNQPQENTQDPQFNASYQQPQQPYYPQPQPAPQAPENSGTHGKAIASLVLGIVALVCAWLGWGALVAIAASIVGIIFAVGVRKNPEAAADHGLALGGLICSIIALVPATIGFIACTLCAGVLGAGAAALPNLEEYLVAVR